jgi:hypothetical protein
MTLFSKLKIIRFEVNVGLNIHSTYSSFLFDLTDIKVQREHNRVNIDKHKKRFNGFN